MAESQDPLFDFLSFRMDTPPSCVGGIRFRTRPSRFLQPTHERWYGKESRARVPVKDLLIDEKAVLFWLLGAWRQGGPMALPCACDAADRKLAQERIVKITGWGASLQKNAIVIDEMHRPAVVQWLRQRVPEKVWNPEKQLT